MLGELVEAPLGPLVASMDPRRASCANIPVMRSTPCPLLGAALAASLAFGCTPDVPETLRYRVQIQPASDATAPEGRAVHEEVEGYRGWTLMAGDEELGVFEREHRVTAAYFDRPSAERPSRFARGLRMRVAGACGSVEQALPEAEPLVAESDSDDYVAETMDHFGYLPVYYRLPRVETGVTTVRVAWGGATGGTLHIGETAVEPGVDEVRVITAGCEGAVPVRWNDRRIGELGLEVGAPLITVDPDVCHRFASQTYGNRYGDRREEQVIEGATVVGLPHAIDHWMEPMPDHVTVARSNVPGLDATATRTELVRVDCPPAGATEEEPAEAAAGDLPAPSPSDRRESLRRELMEEARRRRAARRRPAPEAPSMFGDPI